MEEGLRYLREGRNLMIRRKKWSMTFSAKQIKNQCQHGKKSMSRNGEKEPQKEREREREREREQLPVTVPKPRNLLDSRFTCIPLNKSTKTNRENGMRTGRCIVHQCCCCRADLIHYPEENSPTTIQNDKGNDIRGVKGMDIWKGRKRIEGIGKGIRCLKWNERQGYE